jgi:hypothetical protein
MRLLGAILFITLYNFFFESSAPCMYRQAIDLTWYFGGANRNRTDDLLNAIQTLPVGAT